LPLACWGRWRWWPCWQRRCDDDGSDAAFAHAGEVDFRRAYAAPKRRMRAHLRGLGIEAALPRGFEGRIFRRPESDGARSYAVAQFATIPLPPVRSVGDFGSGIVQHLGARDVLAVLFEYGPESLGTALFARAGLPPTIGLDRFNTFRLRRGMPGQAGTQCFFTEAGRPFTLYAVLGSYEHGAVCLSRLNALLAEISVSRPEQIS
jgi:hypothetical protein